MTYSIEEWMWGMEEDAPKVEARNGGVIDCRSEQRNAHFQHAGEGSQQHRRQGRPWFPRDMSGGSSSSGVGSSDRGSNQSDSNQPWCQHKEDVTDQCSQEGVLG